MKSLPWSSIRPSGLHAGLGPDIFEIVYEVRLAHELRKRGYTVERHRQRVPPPNARRVLTCRLCSRARYCFRSRAADEEGNCRSLRRRVRAKPDHCSLRINSYRQRPFRFCGRDRDVGFGTTRVRRSSIACRLPSGPRNRASRHAILHPDPDRRIGKGLCGSYLFR